MTFFMSYRREDHQFADRLADELKKIFGPAAVFVDVQSIRMGDEFEERIYSSIESSTALLAIIGADWLDAVSPTTGHRKLDDPTDFVRKEIALALRRGIPVFPILIEPATPPKMDDLPDDLKPLSALQGHSVHRKTYHTDVGTLIDILKDQFPHILPKQLTPLEELLGGLLFAAVVILAVVAVVMSWARSGPDPRRVAEEAKRRELCGQLERNAAYFEKEIAKFKALEPQTVAGAQWRDSLPGRQRQTEEELSANGCRKDPKAK